MTKNKSVRVRLSDDDYDELRVIGLLESCNISFIIRTVLRDYTKYYNHINSDKVEGIKKYLTNE